MMTKPVSECSRTERRVSLSAVSDIRGGGLCMRAGSSRNRQMNLQLEAREESEGTRNVRMALG